MRAWLAWAQIAPSGTRRATQTMPLSALTPFRMLVPLPMSSMIQASFLSAMEKVSPSEA